MHLLNPYYRTQLAVSGEFLDAPELPPTDFLQKIDSAITGFSCPVPCKPLPKALLSSEFVFVCEDASSPPLSQLYRGQYKVITRKDKYFKLQIGSKVDNVSVDRLKPVFSDEKVSPALPQPHGRPPRCPSPPVSKPLSPSFEPPPPVTRTNKAVCFSLPSQWNRPQVTLLSRRFVSALF